MFSKHFLLGFFAFLLRNLATLLKNQNGKLFIHCLTT